MGLLQEANKLLRMVYIGVITIRQVIEPISYSSKKAKSHMTLHWLKPVVSRKMIWPIHP